MFGHLARSSFEWNRVQVFFVDERAVPPTHADSNFASAEQHLFRPARIPHRNVHRIHGELAPQQAAKHYEHEIRETLNLATGELPHFDVVHLGMGADSHTASLFPGERLIEDREDIVAAIPKPARAPHARITLLPGALLAARHAAVLVCGADKAEAIHRAFHAPYDPLEVPAQIIAHHSRRTTWFLDTGAARLLGDSPAAQHMHS
jgi:6-phosphogluconolactonase